MVGDLLLEALLLDEPGMQDDLGFVVDGFPRTACQVGSRNALAGLVIGMSGGSSTRCIATAPGGNLFQAVLLELLPLCCALQFNQKLSKGAFMASHSVAMCVCHGVGQLQAAAVFSWSKMSTISA
jgi:hypothetical protein